MCDALIKLWITFNDVWHYNINHFNESAYRCSHRIASWKIKTPFNQSKSSIDEHKYFSCVFLDEPISGVSANFHNSFASFLWNARIIWITSVSDCRTKITKLKIKWEEQRAHVQVVCSILDLKKLAKKLSNEFSCPDSRLTLQEEKKTKRNIHFHFG